MLLENLVVLLLSSCLPLPYFSHTNTSLKFGIRASLCMGRWAMYNGSLMFFGRDQGEPVMTLVTSRGRSISRGWE